MQYTWSGAKDNTSNMDDVNEHVSKDAEKAMPSSQEEVL